MNKIRLFILAILLCFANFNVQAQYRFPTASGLILYDVTAEADADLEWVEYHINLVDDSQQHPNGYASGIFQEYVLYNNGNTSHIIRFVVQYQYSNEVVRELLFKINDVAVQHQIIYAEEMDLSRIGFFAFYDVVFPAGERTKIRIYERTRARKFDCDYFISNGTPRFTATIGNHRLDTGSPHFEIEDLWIGDIIFFSGINRARISLLSMLEQEGSPSNGLFTIRKMNGNTWEIDFSEQFVVEHRSHLTFFIEWVKWGMMVIPGGAPLHIPFQGGIIGEWYFNVEEPITLYQYVFFTNRQLRVLRNAFFARHGFVFMDQGLGGMFENFHSPPFGNFKYIPNSNFHEGMLTEIDRANISIIQRLEVMAGDKY
jgi:hypothetical protein